MSTIPELKPWREVAMEKALKASEARVRELEEERRNAWSKAMGRLKKPKATYTYKEVRSILLELRRGTWPIGMIDPNTKHADLDVIYFVNVINAFESKGVVLDPHRKPSSDPA